MKNKAKLFGIYLPTFVLITIATITLRTVALFLQFDTSTGYYKNNVLINIANYIVVGAIFLFFTYIFTARKDMRFIPDFTSAATYIPTGAVTVAILFLTVHLISESAVTINIINELQKTPYPYVISQITSLRGMFFLMIVTAVFSILSAIHFTLTSILEKQSSTKRAYFGIFTVIFFSLYAAYIYFSQALPLNAPNKLLDQMIYLFCAVFFLFETRLSLGREKWRSYIAFGFIAALLSAYDSIPSIIFYIFKSELTSLSIYDTVLTFSLFTFIISRLLLTGDLIEDKISPTVSALIGFSNFRTEQISPKAQKSEIIEISGESLEQFSDDTESEEPDENQITIDDMRIDDDENQISIYDMKPIINEEEETIEAVKLSAEEQDEKSETEQSTESL